MRLPCLALTWAISVGSLLAQKTPEETQDQMTFRALCGSCHATSLVEGLRTEEEWKEEVAQMIKIGARGTEAQWERVMRVLARTLTKVNVNTAEAGQIAPVLDCTGAVAAEVVKRRTANGDFKSLDDLMQIPGLDPAKLESRKDRILF